MSISFTLLPEDFFAVTKQQLKYPSWFLKYCLGLFVVAGTAWIFIGEYFKHRNTLNTIVLSLITFSILTIIAWSSWVMMKRYIKRATIKQNRNELCVHTLTLTDNEIIESTDHNQSRYLWSIIHKIDELSNHILIYINPALVHIIPKRAFATPDQMREFYQMAVALQKSAKKV